VNIAKNMGLAKIAVAEQKLTFNLCLCFKSFFIKHDFPKIVIKIHDKFTIHGKHTFSWLEA
jgi:hypothetical protein